MNADQREQGNHTKSTRKPNLGFRRINVVSILAVEQCNRSISSWRSDGSSPNQFCVLWAWKKLMIASLKACGVGSLLHAIKSGQTPSQ